MSQATPQQCFDKLNDLLQGQINEICDLNAYLADIKSAIVSGNPDLLIQLISQQRAPLERMETLESQRCDLLQIYGFQSRKDGLQSCIQWCDQNSTLDTLYQEFEQSLHELQRSLRLNSLLVNKNQKRIRQSLHMLTGQDTSNRSPTYSAAGIAEEFNNLRSLARA